jgi:uncharacterized protein (TIGR00375 family)
MGPAGLDHWARLKGIDVVGTGDCVHPRYLEELRTSLVEAEPGLYRYARAPDERVRFLCSVELALIYKHRERTRKVHHLVLLPSLETAARLSAQLAKHGKIAGDGRPILGLSSRELLDLVLSVDARCALIPAHVWTPWFSLFGSRSGYDALEDCFGVEGAKEIFALETGLSSDRPMNRRISALDRLALVSYSDAHSPSKLGREATVLEAPRSYDGILGAIRENSRASLPFTIEFFPEEGKYHYDGHRDCRVRLHPRESAEGKLKCPSCGRPLTLGVLHRSEALADRPRDYVHPQEEGRQRSVIPLEELIAAVRSCGVATQGVRREYLHLVAEFGSEFAILLDLDPAQLARRDFRLAEALRRMRAGQVQVSPGYDGEFGKVLIFRNSE